MKTRLAVDQYFRGVPRALRHAATWGGVTALTAGTVAVGLTAAAPSTAGAVARVVPAVVAARPAVPAGAKALGAVRGVESISGEVALKSSNPAGLSTYATEVSNPSSPDYHHYLTAGAFASTFGPSPAAITAVKSQLTSSGLTVSSVSRNGLLISFTGSESSVSSTFHSNIESYQLTSGRQAIAPTGALTLPSTVAADIQSVIGLNTFVVPAAIGALPSQTGHPAAKVPAGATSSADGPSACSAASQDAEEYGGLTDDEIANAYGVNGLYKAGDDGAGQTIAVYELEPFARADQQKFDQCYFGDTQAASMLSRLHVVPVDGGQPGGAGSGESELDLDDVSALAPGATIDVYEAPGTDAGYIDNFNRIVEDDTAKIVTSSWYSGCETQVATEEPGLEQVENTIFEQAAAQGQSVLEAAGDDGSDGCAIHGSSPVTPYLSSSDPASQPYITAVGGTTITDATTPPAEQVWNDGALWGAGSGGISAIWPSPTWQADSGVPGVYNRTVVSAAQVVNGGTFCDAAVCREIPDVSAQGDEFTGAVTVYYSPDNGWITIGGTSSATPLWAAMLADIDSTQLCESNNGIGFANPALYRIASIPSEYASSFNDITQGNNDVFGDAGGLYPATTGYDMGVGLGSPKVTNPNGTPGLAHYLCVTPSETPPSVNSVTPPAIPEAGQTVTIAGSGFEASGTPDVAEVQVGTDDLPASAVTVTSPTSMTVALPASTEQAGTAAPTDGTGTYDILVRLTNGEQSAISEASRVIYDAGTTSLLPQVDGIASAGGNEAGGNTVTVYGSGFSAGTQNPPTVTFGGVASTSVVVLSDSELTAVVPAFSSGSTDCATALDLTTDGICQAQVQVTTSEGASIESTILPEYSAAVAADTSLNSEQYPAASEYDYLPTPTISSIQVTQASADCTANSAATACASQGGGSVATITGTGFGVLGLSWVNVGPSDLAASEDYSMDSVTPTTIEVTLPATTVSTKETTVPVSVQTYGSPNVANYDASDPSNLVDVSYAPTPVLKSIAVTRGGVVSTITAGPADGGTKLSLTGSGFGSATSVAFVDVGQSGGSYGFSDATSFSLTSVTPTSVSLVTPSDNPGIDAVELCDASGCSQPVSTKDTYVFYPTGNPVVTALSTSSGPAGTKVVISGKNLGFATSVEFGSTRATKFANVPGLLDSGSTFSVTATVPAGSVGSKVAIRVQTLGSLVDGFGYSAANPAATFTYKS